MVSGSKANERNLNAILNACNEHADLGEQRFDPRENSALRVAILNARREMIPDNYVFRAIQCKP